MSTTLQASGALNASDGRSACGLESAVWLWNLSSLQARSTPKWLSVLANVLVGHVEVASGKL